MRRGRGGAEFRADRRRERSASVARHCRWSRRRRHRRRRGTPSSAVARRVWPPPVLRRRGSERRHRSAEDGKVWPWQEVAVGVRSTSRRSSRHTHQSVDDRTMQTERLSGSVKPIGRDPQRRRGRDRPAHDPGSGRCYGVSAIRFIVSIIEQQTRRDGNGTMSTSPGALAIGAPGAVAGSSSLNRATHPRTANAAHSLAALCDLQRPPGPRRHDDLSLPPTTGERVGMSFVSAARPRGSRRRSAIEQGVGRRLRRVDRPHARATSTST